MLGFISKIFGGSKSDKDVKRISPAVEAINAEFAKLANVSNDELRAKTQEFKQRIQDHLTHIDQEIYFKREEIAAMDIAQQSQPGVYEEVDKLVKRRDELIEEVLEQIHPEAFAVVKETARRFF